MGQLKKMGLDFVACTQKRLPYQIKEIFNTASSPIYNEKSFILALQEVWTENAFERIKFEADARNFSIYPNSYEEVQWSGLVTITNLDISEATIHYFKKSDYRYKSFHYLILKKDVGKSINFINTHTDFSSWGIINSTHLSQIEDLEKFISKIKKNKIVLAGDFNIGPHTYSPNSKRIEKSKLWSEKLYPIIAKMPLVHLKVPGYSWDMDKNLLAIKSTFILNIYNFLRHATIYWEEKSEMIDHLFVSPSFKALEMGLTFEKHLKFKCFGRNDRFGRTALSDHYGIFAILE